ncbi:TonB-dependent siderophore receptor [Oceanobacter mangrovi]|uniref:TonB-dependent siderophore receptor n=1 Tax=Oceanobacter mangrovi TaxID=2862510 RepID=UPI001C8EFD9F|nr:TonB-dependent siderophore receptor [Oceanobacter mangrovi]
MHFSANISVLVLLAAPLAVQADEAAGEQTSAAADVEDTLVVVGKQQSWFEQQAATAMKMDSDLLQTPFSQNTINAAMLEDLKASTLETAYGYLAGVSRSGEGANSFTIRGMAADLQNIQVDGLPGLVSRFGAPVTANIERVEVLKGPASVLYGLMEPGGLVNIVTRKPEADSHGSVDLSYQNYVNQQKGGYQGSVDYTGALDDDAEYLYRIIGGGERSNSFRDCVDTETEYLYPSFSRLWANSRLDVQLEYTHEKRGADQGLAVLNHDIDTAASIETYYQEPGDYELDEGYGLAVAYQQTLSDALSFNVKWRSILHEDENRRYENTTVNQDEGTLTRRNRHQLNKRAYHFLDANLSWNLDGAIPQQLLLGFNGGYEYRQYDRLDWDSRGAEIDIADPEYTGRILAYNPGSMRRWKLYNVGVYGFDKLSLGERWTLVVGARYDQQQGDYRSFYLDKDDTEHEASRTSSTNYSSGLVYQASDEWSLYSSYAESFDPQTVGTYDANGDQLEPEQAEQYELGSKYASPDGRLNVQLAWFDITKHNVVEDNDGVNELVGRVHSRGVEFNGQYQVTDQWQLQTAWAWINARVTETLNADASYSSPAFAPVHTASLWSRYNYPAMVWGGFVGGSVGLQHQSQRYTDESRSDRVRLPGYTIMQLGMYYERMYSKYALNVANLTNEVYYTGGRSDTKIWPGEPTKVTLTAQFDF